MVKKNLLPQNKIFIFIYAAKKTGNPTDIINYIDRAKPIVRKCLDDKTLSSVVVADLQSGGKLYETPSRQLSYSIRRDLTSGECRGDPYIDRLRETSSQND